MFVALEGIDGSGKTTLMHRLIDSLRAAGVTVYPTREPTDGPVGRLIREALLSFGGEQLGDAVMPYLFAADRRDHLDREILPALGRGELVITDRYYLSSVAYQSLIHQTLPARLNEGFPDPDLVIYLDLPVETCLARLARRGKQDRYEVEAHLRAVAASYEAALTWARNRGVEVMRLEGEDMERHAEAVLGWVRR